MTAPEQEITFGMENTSLEDWVNWLKEKEMPIFSDTAMKICRTMDNKHAGAMELSNIILQDPNLTARLLKISNTPFYNPSSQRLSTITRAIVILGYGMVRELTIACAFIEEITSENNKDVVNLEIATAIHAAVQAKALAQLTNDSSPEEVFVAALLKNLGAIVFKCYAYEQIEQIEDTLKTNQLTQEEAEKQVLGFLIKELGISLSATWQLGGLIDDAISGKQSPRLEIINLGHQLASNANDGWPKDELDVFFGKLEKLTRHSREHLEKVLHHNTETAIKVASQFGAHEAAKMIPTDFLRESVSPTLILDYEEEPEVKPQEQINTQVQFEILQDIALALSGPIDINMLMELVLEGIHRSLNMDHTLFALLTPNRRGLKEKFSVGWDKEKKDHDFLVPLDKESNIFSYGLKQNDGTWINPEKDFKLMQLYTQAIKGSFGVNECMMMPVHINNNNIGLFYSDRQRGKSTITDTIFACFKHFTQQANLGLAISRQKSR